VEKMREEAKQFSELPKATSSPCMSAPSTNLSRPIHTQENGPTGVEGRQEIEKKPSLMRRLAKIIARLGCHKG
jgi:hypothetical protein